MKNLELEVTGKQGFEVAWDAQIVKDKNFARINSENAKKHTLLE